MLTITPLMLNKILFLTARYKTCAGSSLKWLVRRLVGLGLVRMVSATVMSFQVAFSTNIMNFAERNLSTPSFRVFCMYTGAASINLLFLVQTNSLLLHVKTGVDIYNFKSGSS